MDAREYHERTKHSPRSVREDSFSLDFATKPRPYKVYEDLPRRSIQAPPTAPSSPALSAVSTPGGDPASGRPYPEESPASGSAASAPVDAGTLHALCHYATGVTKELDRGGRTMRFRAAACTGKLYHVDLYAVTGDLGALGPGVYHFDPHADAFDVLREGDYRGVLARAAGNHPGVADAPVTFVATAEWWRNAWKYRERTYRHAFWDSGTVLANLLATAHGGGHRAVVVTGFADHAVADVVGVDPETEAPLELVPVGSGDPVPDPRPVEAIDPSVVPPSRETVEYPAVHEAWAASTLPDGAAVREWRDRPGRPGGDDVGPRGPGDGERFDLDPVDAETASGRPVGATVERRGSLREYSHEPVSARTVATVLDRALGPFPTDVSPADASVPTDGPGGPGELWPLEAYCLLHAVEGIPSGAYRYHRGAGVLERVGDTDRRTAGHLALDQTVVGDAAVNVYLLADVDALVDALGNRGYRLAQLAGGVGLGRLYLATYAHLSLGGRGFTFYDDLVTDHFSPRAAGWTPMTLFAFGRPGSRED